MAGCDGQGVGPDEGFVLVFAEVNPVAEHALDVVHGFGIEGANGRPGLQQRFDGIDGGGFPNIVGIRLEGQAPQGERLPGQVLAVACFDLIDQLAECAVLVFEQVLYSDELFDFSLLEDQDLVAAEDCLDPVRDDQHRALLELALHSLLDHSFRLQVDTRGGFIHDNNLPPADQ